ncbi:competence type IV pilus minor pilin ComGF [Bacillus sp. Marseille-Q1617]|uniref:competence type IV pilus minor pilin ComGF n=1 Tax=Bacillus sp. Marseille-Q1617 TaxID=2736887 RepID=UPI00158A6531|nr:competence type IV pilus minor pilin ComGF [Bacillus sp. Marseille-Q1617]
MKSVLQNNKGFTLLDALLSLLVLSIISLSFPLIMKGFQTIKTVSVPPRYYEWNLFSESLRNEMWGSGNIMISPEQLSFDKEGERITYERYQNSIRRKVNERGHEVVLQSIHTLAFSQVPQGVKVEIKFEKGEGMESEFYYFQKNPTSEIPG